VYQDAWWVANVDVLHNTDEETHWNGSAKFPPCNYAGTPLAATPGAKDLEGGDKVIGMLRKKSLLMEPVAVQLQERLRDCMVQYGAKPTKD
jgi:hypothetical protein